MTRTLGSLAAAAALAATVTACGPSHRPHAVPSPTSSAAKADEQQAANMLQHCLPKNLLALTGKTGRQTFVKCLEIPPAKRPAFTACVTQAAETSHLASKAGRTRFTEVALPRCYEAAR